MIEPWDTPKEALGAVIGDGLVPGASADAAAPGLLANAAIEAESRKRYIIETCFLHDYAYMGLDELEEMHRRIPPWAYVDPKTRPNMEQELQQLEEQDTNAGEPASAEVPGKINPGPYRGWLRSEKKRRTARIRELQLIIRGLDFREEAIGSCILRKKSDEALAEARRTISAPRDEHTSEGSQDYVGAGSTTTGEVVDNTSTTFAGKIHDRWTEETNASTAPVLMSFLTVIGIAAICGLLNYSCSRIDRPYQRPAPGQAPVEQQETSKGTTP